MKTVSAVSVKFINPEGLVTKAVTVVRGRAKYNQIDEVKERYGTVRSYVSDFDILGTKKVADNFDYSASDAVKQIFGIEPI